MGWGRGPGTHSAVEGAPLPKRREARDKDRGANSPVVASQGAGPERPTRAGVGAGPGPEAGTPCLAQSQAHGRWEENGRNRSHAWVPLLFSTDPSKQAPRVPPPPPPPLLAPRPAGPAYAPILAPAGQAVPHPPWCPVHGAWPKLRKHSSDKKYVSLAAAAAIRTVPPPGRT